MKKTLSALALGVALATVPLPRVKADAFDNPGSGSIGVGLSANLYPMTLNGSMYYPIALKGVLDFNDNFGVQARAGSIFASLDFRFKKRLFDFVNLYGYTGGIWLSPWEYSLPQCPDEPVFGLNLGAGFEMGRKKGVSFGIEGGFIIPIPKDPKFGFFYVNTDLMYRLSL